MHNLSSTKQRIFIVGCPRSGTTLLQSLLAAHSDIASFPESHLFWSLVADRGWLRRNFKLVSRKARPQFRQFVEETQARSLERFLPGKFSFSLNTYAKKFVKALDALSDQQRKDIWIEKTPRHLHHIDFIESLIPDGKFIHIIRNGEDVVASLYEVTHKHPEIWNGARDIDTCITRWMNDVNTSMTYRGRSNHYIVSYEHLVQNTRFILDEICNFLNISFDEKMIQQYPEAAKKVSLKTEEWKESATGEIKTESFHKFSKIFSDEQQEYISERVSSTNLQGGFLGNSEKQFHTGAV